MCPLTEVVAAVPSQISLLRCNKKRAGCLLPASRRRGSRKIGGQRTKKNLQGGMRLCGKHFLPCRNPRASRCPSDLRGGLLYSFGADRGGLSRLDRRTQSKALSSYYGRGAGHLIKSEAGPGSSDSKCAAIFAMGGLPGSRFGVLCLAYSMRQGEEGTGSNLEYWLHLHEVERIKLHFPQAH